jgi:tRNA (cmo5U34)-methyltransferase
MNEFDIKAKEWDSNPVHLDRSETIAQRIIDAGFLKKEMTAIEFGTGTGILSFLLADRLKEIIMIDTSAEMVKKAREKIDERKTSNLTPLLFDLEKDDYPGEKTDFIFSQMVLHHIADTEAIIKTFDNLLNKGGYLAIADLYSEDGSFHGEGFTGHNGFDIEALKKEVEECGFSDVQITECYKIRKTVNETVKEYPLFLLIARK